MPANLPPNQCHPELIGVHSINFAVDKNSSARGVMSLSHFSQRLPIDGATERRIQTGVCRELGKYTFNVAMPANGRIIKVIDRYPRRADVDSIAMNPETIVIYEDEATKEIGHFSIPYYASYHQSFGYRFNQTPNMARLARGNYFEKGTVFADSPCIKENGGYAYGIELNMCMMSDPAVSEDGFKISRDVLERLKFRVYETRVIECGNTHFPLNLYGTKDRYQPFPEIGQTIRDDGLLMALRSYSPGLMAVEMSYMDVMEPDIMFDKLVYARGTPGGRVVDIKMYHDDEEFSPMPMGIMANVDKYHRAYKRFCQEILDTEKDIRQERRKKHHESGLVLKPETQELLVRCQAIVSDASNRSTQRLHKLHRKTPIDCYRIEIVVEYEVIPDIGFKMADMAGGRHHVNLDF